MRNTYTKEVVLKQKWFSELDMADLEHCSILSEGLTQLIKDYTLKKQPATPVLNIVDYVLFD